MITTAHLTWIMYAALSAQGLGLLYSFTPYVQTDNDFKVHVCFLDVNEVISCPHCAYVCCCLNSTAELRVVIVFLITRCVHFKLLLKFTIPSASEKICFCE